MSNFSDFCLKIADLSMREIGVGDKKTLCQPWNYIISDTHQNFISYPFQWVKCLWASGSDWAIAYFSNCLCPGTLRKWHYSKGMLGYLLNLLVPKTTDRWTLVSPSAVWISRGLRGISISYTWTHWLENSGLSNRCHFTFSSFSFKCHPGPPNPGNQGFRILSCCCHLFFARKC